MASGAGLDSRMRRFPCRAVARPAHPFGRPRTPGSPSSAAHAGSIIACLSRMRGRRPSRIQVGVLDAPAPVPIWPPAKPGVCRPDAATTWRGPTAPMRWPTWAGLHSRMWRFPWTVPGPVDTSSRPGCANLLRLSAAHPRALSSRLSARAVGAGLDQLCPESSANSIMVAVVVGPCGRRAALSTGRGCEHHAAMRRASLLCSRRSFMLR